MEKAERGKNAQLAYSFDIALQNEFSLEENIALARQFLLENFVSRGMVVDFAVHLSLIHIYLIAMLKKISPFFKWDGLLHVLVGEKFL